MTVTKRNLGDWPWLVKRTSFNSSPSDPQLRSETRRIIWSGRSSASHAERAASQLLSIDLTPRDRLIDNVE